MLNNEKRKGKIMVLTGPSGVGKGTIISSILKNLEDIVLSISATTRKPRPGEQDGVQYYFKTVDEFKKLIDSDKMLEWAQFADNYYGTLYSSVEKELELGNDVVLEIDVQGALQVKSKLPDAILVFICPPSFEELKHRLVNRQTESSEVIEKRLNIAKSELDMAEKFDYQIVNDKLDIAIKDLQNLILRIRNDSICNKND